MNIQQANRIPLAAVLARLGIAPRHECQDELW